MSEFLIRKLRTPRTWKLSIAAGILILGASALGICFAQERLPDTRGLDARLNEQIVMIGAGSPVAPIELETTVFKPPGNGPFPLLLMNHGKEPGNPHFQKRDRFVFLAREFVKRGYAVVIPMRKGFSRSTGEYSDFGCNMAGNGQLQANDVQSVIEHLVKQPWVDADRIVVAGQSYGGLATMALGTRYIPGVRGLINFAGGLRADSGDCQWKESLVTAFTDYGGRTALPSLWFYGENDSYFNHDLAYRLLSAYTSSGGNAQLVAFSSFKSDAHGMVGSRDGVKIWWPETEKFLQKIGMPTQEVLALAEDAPIPPTGYANIDDIDAVPYLREKGREAYRAFLKKSSPKAFAVSPSGAWSWAEEGEDPVERVLASCQANSRQPCKLYAVDSHVVWTDHPGMPMQQNLATTNTPAAESTGQ